MGPGIFTHYTKQVIGGLLAAFVLLGAVMLYFYFRGPVGRVSPYDTVNDLHEWEYMTLRSQYPEYPKQTEEVWLYFRNDAPDGAVVLAGEPVSSQWELEKLENGRWRTMRATLDRRAFNFPEEYVFPHSGPSTVVSWKGGELWLRCDLALCYPWPLEAGEYRIVIPGCQHFEDSGALAAEFRIIAAGFEVEE